MELQYPTRTHSARPVSNLDQSWLKTENAQMIIVQGERGSGKSVVLDHVAELFYEKGFLICHLWGASSLENMYWAVSKSCKKVWDAWRVENEKLPINERKPEGVHCNCDKSYPVIWVIPENYTIEQHLIDAFNGVNFKDKEEYYEFYNNGFVDDFIPDEPWVEWNKIRKPEAFVPKTPLIITRKIPPPRNSQQTQVLRDEFIKIMYEAKTSHRIIVMNPETLLPSDKFKTVAEIMKTITYAQQNVFIKQTPKSLDKPESEWNKYERNWHNMVVVINEARTIMPSGRLYGEKGAGDSRRVFFDFVPETRHKNVWLLLDTQNHEDLDSSLKKQASIRVLKRGSEELFGDDYKWLFKKIEEERKAMIMARGGFPDMGIIKDINIKRPRIQELPDNQGYVVYSNNEFEKMTFGMARFHHKQSGESFISDTGIRGKLDEIVEKGKEEKENKTESKKIVKERERKQHQDIMLKIDAQRKAKIKWKDILINLRDMEEKGIIPTLGYGSYTEKAITNKYTRWLNDQNKEYV